MKLIIQRGSELKNVPVIVDNVTYTVFTDDDANPIGVVEHVGASVIQFTTCQDPNFGLLLRRLGVKATMPSVEVVRK